MLTDDECCGASLYLGWAHDSMIIARHSDDARDFWVGEAINHTRSAALRMGFDLVPRPAEKLEAAE